MSISIVRIYALCRYLYEIFIYDYNLPINYICMCVMCSLHLNNKIKYIYKSTIYTRISVYGRICVRLLLQLHACCLIKTKLHTKKLSGWPSAHSAQWQEPPLCHYYTFSLVMMKFHFCCTLERLLMRRLPNSLHIPASRSPHNSSHSFVADFHLICSLDHGDHGDCGISETWS